MTSLYLRIYATVVVVLLLFAFGSGWIVQRHLDQERASNEQVVSERLGAWADLLENALPGVNAAPEVQAAALNEWSQRLRVPLALDSPTGERIGASESFLRRAADGQRAFSFKLDDGRTLWTMRWGGRRQAGSGAQASGAADERPRGRASQQWPMVLPGLSRGAGLVVVLIVLFIAVAAGAYPVVRRLTRRLEALKSGVEQFGAGQLGHRVAISGHDEVGAVAASFNVAAARVEALVRSHQSLLANASHELRSPLARMKMAVSMLDKAGPEQRERLKREIDTNVAELDALVEEVLLASRLDATRDQLRGEPVDLLAVAVEESSHVDAVVDAPGSLFVSGETRLLHRALRNLLENARRYGGGSIEVSLRSLPGAAVSRAEIRVCDRGPGVPAEMRERIFEPFFRMPGHAEQDGGVGLGLALVKQIAERHGGSVRCEARAGGGSCFVIELPVAAMHAPAAAALATA
ncbi:MAG TPA: HAMP domain-containing sensor histidine kinase [Caldimonas sp.]|jgi:signal transduction histidine kinase|nr:HAMP domain-containing sensor histidine kinase [Caldimonas sp.]HEX2542091.1 HAMP domain-containing sensor histidine kinase [Caldimonas sp.]